MHPRDADTSAVLAFVESALPPPPATVLEVGCGDGRLAETLIARGWAVTAIDASEKAVAAARERGVAAERRDFVSYTGGPFEALLFTRSFHHIWPLEAAARKVRELLAPGGVAVFDEFAHDEIDRFTAAWFFDLQEALEAAGADGHGHAGHGHGGHGHAGHQHGHDRGEPPRDPLERWRWRLAHDPPLHGARMMLDALGAGLEIERVERVPYLHRYLAQHLAAADVFERIRELETERVDQGVLVPIGLRIVARG